VREYDAGEFGGEGEPLVAVTRFRHYEQRRLLRVGADHGGQRGARLACQCERYEHQRALADVQVANGAYRLGNLAFGRDRAG
jgi:hypothetical protein